MNISKIINIQVKFNNFNLLFYSKIPIHYSLCLLSIIIAAHKIK
jgi:hypothetical protein